MALYIIRSCSPSINYDLDKTCALKEKVKNLREGGLEIYLYKMQDLILSYCF